MLGLRSHLENFQLYVRDAKISGFHFGREEADHLCCSQEICSQCMSHQANVGCECEPHTRAQDPMAPNIEYCI